MIRGARVNVAAFPLGGKAMSLPLPDIRIENLGSQGDGITVPELSKQVVGEVVKGSMVVIAKSADQIFKGASEAAKSLGDEGKTAADVVKGIGNLFK